MNTIGGIREIGAIAAPPNRRPTPSTKGIKIHGHWTIEVAFRSIGSPVPRSSPWILS
jgi:hypothetical protein